MANTTSTALPFCGSFGLTGDQYTYNYAYVGGVGDGLTTDLGQKVYRKFLRRNRCRSSLERMP